MPMHRYVSASNGAGPAVLLGEGSLDIECILSLQRFIHKRYQLSI